MPQNNLGTGSTELLIARVPVISKINPESEILLKEAISTVAWNPKLSRHLTHQVFFYGGFLPHKICKEAEQ